MLRPSATESGCSLTLLCYVFVLNRFGKVPVFNLTDQEPSTSKSADPTSRLLPPGLNLSVHTGDSGAGIAFCWQQMPQVQVRVDFTLQNLNTDQAFAVIRNPRLLDETTPLAPQRSSRLALRPSSWRTGT